MPRRKFGFEERPRPIDEDLVNSLVDELKSNRELGQPVIDEQAFPSGQIRVTVIWDEWDHLPMEDRTSIILRAYELAEGREYRENIALASGLTVPEAYAAGMLPLRIIPALRKTDSVTAEQCRQAMIEVGASTLFGTDQPQLRFASMDEAEAVRKKLVQLLPSSEQVWVITQEVGNADEWVRR